MTTPRALRISTGSRPPSPEFNARGQVFAWSANLSRGASIMEQGIIELAEEEVKAFRLKAIDNVPSMAKELRCMVKSGVLCKNDKRMLERAIWNLYYRKSKCLSSSSTVSGLKLDPMFFWTLQVLPGYARLAVEVLRAIGLIPSSGFELEGYRHNFEHRGIGFMAGPYSMYESSAHFLQRRTRDPQGLRRGIARRQMTTLSQRTRRQPEPIVAHDPTLTQMVASTERTDPLPEPTDVVFDHGYNAELDILSDPGF